MACLRWKMTAADDLSGKRSRKATAWALLAALTLFCTAGIASSPQREEVARTLAPLAAPLAAPELRLPDLEGRLVNLDELGDQVVLINFWATWCPPCRKEMPALQRLSERLGAEPFVLLGVNVGEDAERIRGFLQSLPVAPGFPMLMDRSGAAARAWETRVVPTTWVIDRSGFRVLGAIGEVDYDSPELVEQLRSLIAREPTAGVRH